MKILLAGATGFLGSRLVAALVREGHTVAAFSRDAAAARRRLPALDRAWSWNPRAGLPCPGVIDQFDAVVNLAGENIFGYWTEKKKRALVDSRILSTRCLVDGIRRADPRPPVFVSGSAIGYYGDRGDEELTESSPPGQGFFPDLCVEWEAEAQQATELGVRVACTRTGLVLGHGGGVLEKMLPAFRLGLGGPLGSGKQWMSWIHVHDLVGIILLALYNDVHGPLNAVAPEPARQGAFAKSLGRVLRRPAFARVPGFVLRLGGELGGEVLASTRVIPEATLASGYWYRYGGLEDALRAAVRSPAPAEAATT